jgi:hypothetical protein
LDIELQHAKHDKEDEESNDGGDAEQNVEDDVAGSCGLREELEHGSSLETKFGD